MSDNIVEQVAKVVVDKIFDADPSRVVVGISNRHVHLTDEDFKTLFGYDHPEVYKYVRQHGEFAAKESVTIVGPKGTFERVRVMGPNRTATQVEIAATDARALGVQAPMAQSGHLENAAPITIIGPKGQVERKAAIIAGRHIHMGPSDAAALGLKDQDRVSVQFDGDRAARLDNFLVRVKDSYLLELHLDTDEGNAVSYRSGDWALILGK